VSAGNPWTDPEQAIATKNNNIPVWLGLTDPKHRKRFGEQRIECDAP
jgi:hypothetical protein